MSFNILKLNIMQKIAFILLAIMILGSISCNNSNDTPDPDVIYTIEYEVASTGDVTVDTIMYLDVNGDDKYVLGASNWGHSFEQKNGYHAKLYISGTITSGKCGYSIGVKRDGESGYVAIAADSTSSTSALHFKFLREFASSGK